MHFPSILTDWLGGYPAPSEEVSQGLPRAVEVFREDGEAEEGSIIGIVGKNGPIHVDDKAQLDPALLRYVFNLVQASLPPPRPLSDTATSKTDARQSLGLGLGRRKKDDPSRRSSWTNLGWMPGLGTGLSSTSSPAPAALAPPQTASSRVHEPSGPSGSGVDALAMPSKDTKTRWPSLGLGSLGGLGEAMGSMGSALGMGSSPRSYQGPHMAAAAAHASPDPSARVETQESSEPPFSGEVKQPASTANASMQSIESEDLDKAGVSAGANEVDTTVLTTASSSDAAAHHVEQSSVALPDLHAAVQADSQVDLTWDGRGVWVRDLMDRGAYVKRRLSWIIAGPSSAIGGCADIRLARQRSAVRPPTLLCQSTMAHRAQWADALAVLEARHRSHTESAFGRSVIAFNACHGTQLVDIPHRGRHDHGAERARNGSCFGKHPC